MKANQGTNGSSSVLRVAGVEQEIPDACLVVELGAGDLDKVSGGILIERFAPVHDLRLSR